MGCAPRTACTPCLWGRLWRVPSGTLQPHSSTATAGGMVRTACVADATVGISRQSRPAQSLPGNPPDGTLGSLGRRPHTRRLAAGAAHKRLQLACTSPQPSRAAGMAASPGRGGALSHPVHCSLASRRQHATAPTSRPSHPHCRRRHVEPSPPPPPHWAIAACACGRTDPPRMPPPCLLSPRLSPARWPAVHVSCGARCARHLRRQRLRTWARRCARVLPPCLRGRIHTSRGALNQTKPDCRVSCTASIDHSV